MPSRSAGFSLFVPWVASEARPPRKGYPHEGGPHRTAARKGEAVINRHRIRVTDGSRVAGRGRCRMIQRLAFEVAVVIITAAFTYTITSWLAAWLAGGIS